LKKSKPSLLGQTPEEKFRILKQIHYACGLTNNWYIPVMVVGVWDHCKDWLTEDSISYVPPPETADDDN